MKIILEEMDSTLYADVVLSQDDLDELEQGFMVMDKMICHKTTIHIGLRRQRNWDEDEDESADQSWESDA